MLGSFLGRINRFSLWRRTVKVWGYPMHAASLDRLVYLMLHKISLMGVAERRFFEAHIKPGMTVVDVGANLGLYTLLFSRLVGNGGRVIAFEPDPLMFATLVRNCSDLDNINLFNAAVGSRSERRMFCPGVLNSGDNRLAASEETDALCGLWVDVVKLDDIIERQVDFVKIDVQGWEFDVFRGMTGMLQKGVEIFFEFWPYGLSQAGTDPESLLQYIEESGFTVFSAETGQMGEQATPAGAITRSGKRGYVNLYAQWRIN